MLCEMNETQVIKAEFNDTTHEYCPVPALIRKRAVKALPLCEKIRLIKEIDKGNRKKKDIAKEFGIPASTLSTIYKCRDKLNEYADVAIDFRRKRLKKPKYPEVEEIIIKWIASNQNNNVPISGAEIREKAQWFARTLGIENFQASAGWLEKFQNRFRFELNNLKAETVNSNEKDFYQWVNIVMPQIVNLHHENDIFCVSETCLFYKCLLDKSMALKSDYFSDEQREEWVTLLVASNMSGTEKLPLLMIGKRNIPECFSYIKSYPVQYESNRNAIITKAIFEKWITELDQKYLSAHRNVVFIMNYSMSHLKLPEEKLKSVNLILIPATLTSYLQPMDQGIIKSLKYFYRRNTFLKFISLLNEVAQPEITLLDCMRDIHMAWEAVTPSSINQCFRKAGFLKHNSTENEDNVEPVNDVIDKDWAKLQEKSIIPSDMTFESYVNIDENFTLLAHLNDYESVREESVKDDNVSEKLIVPCTVSCSIPSFRETFLASDKLQTFVESRENVPSSVFQAIAHINEFLLKESCSAYMTNDSKMS